MRRDQFTLIIGFNRARRDLHFALIAAPLTPWNCSFRGGCFSQQGWESPLLGSLWSGLPPFHSLCANTVCLYCMHSSIHLSMQILVWIGQHHGQTILHVRMLPRGSPSPRAPNTREDSPLWFLPFGSRIDIDLFCIGWPFICEPFAIDWKTLTAAIVVLLRSQHLLVADH